MAVKQRIQSSHMPPCHRHMVIATNFSSMFDLLLCSTPQAWAECCLELTAVSGYRMFLGLFGYDWEGFEWGGGGLTGALGPTSTTTFAGVAGRWGGGGTPSFSDRFLRRWGTPSHVAGAICMQSIRTSPVPTASIQRGLVKVGGGGVIRAINSITRRNTQNPCRAILFFLAKAKMSWRSLLTSQYSR